MVTFNLTPCCGSLAYNSPTFLTPTTTRSFRRQNSTRTSAIRVGSSCEARRSQRPWCADARMYIAATHLVDHMADPGNHD